jgi:hypothetical protein
MRFRTRQMEPGDESQVNDTFNMLVAGTLAPRSLDVMRRIWHDGPAGPVRSWIVETQTEDGKWRLIGHHGLCPIRYTAGDKDLIFAKTVNSFLLPEFRGKFLYLRFEQRCLAEAEDFLDATYSLLPARARLRAKLQYDVNLQALSLERGLQAPDILSRLLVRMAWRYVRFPARQLAQLLVYAQPSRKSPLALEEFDTEAAISSSFFASFWGEARLTAGLAPRRDIADLSWRFWKMPGAHRTTLAYTWPNGVRGYCIINHTRPFHFTLEDIFLAAPLPNLLQQFLDAIFAWCARRGALMLAFWTAVGGQPLPLMAVYQRNFGISLSRCHRDGPVARRLTSRGQERIGPGWPACNITSIVGPA